MWEARLRPLHKCNGHTIFFRFLDHLALQRVGRKSDPVARVTQHKRLRKRLIKLDMWLMTHYPCNYTKIRTTQRTTPRRSGHDQMEAQAMHALQRHPARQMATMRHRQVRRCVIAADPHDLHSLTRGFAALHARQPALERAGESFGGSHELRAQVRQEG